LQGVLVRLASLGDHFVLDFGGKNELAVSQNMVRADVFLRVFLRFLSVRLGRLSEFSRVVQTLKSLQTRRGDFLAACGGEMRSD